MKKFTLLSIIFLLAISCKNNSDSNLAKHNLIPKPNSVISSGDYFILSNKTNVFFEPKDEELERIKEMMTFELSALLKYPFQKSDSGFRRVSNSIHFVISGEEALSPEAYTLEISKRKIKIVASAPEGLFRGMQTLLQLAALSGSNVVRDENIVALPTGSINDFPQFGYRGTMLDVSRHFFSPEDVKRYIDLLSLYKINFLHLHLSDDQGWRIEIKSWPKLTEIGGSTQVGGGEGGFYTQEEYTDIVKYAADHFITIVPEIDMPGHTNAALASYAELNCDGKATELYTGTRVGFSTLCTRNELTYQFVEDVVREICEMTPGPYFHVGGDESHVTELPDYIYFIDKVKKIVNDQGKTMIGWDEVSHAALEEGDIAQYWASAENATRAVSKGASLIISPADYCYLDMKYDSLTKLGLNWAGYTDVADAYNWKPLELVNGVGKEDILGIESPLWAETIETIDDIEYLAFPRLIGHAEIGWSDNDSLNLEDYLERLEYHREFLRTKGVDFYEW